MRVLLGGLGDDAHSVGIFLIKMALEEHGYQVTFLGIQNELDAFMEKALNHDIIFISSLNGHAELYLTDFEHKISQLKETDHSGRIWYLGGNLSVSKSVIEVEKQFILKGFTRVFPKPVDLDVIIDMLRADLLKYNIKQNGYVSQNSKVQSNAICSDLFANTILTEDLFTKKRIEILESWPTGKYVNNEDTSFNLKNATNLPRVLWKNKLSGLLPLVQPRTGVAELPKQLDLIKKLYKNGIDVNSVQLDAASRRNYYSHAEKGLENSIHLKESCLNGFPVPIHGVEGVKKITNAVPLPFQIRGGAPDHRFVYEIALAGGATGVEGGFICYLFPYDKKTTPLESFLFWQYIDMLTGKIQRENGILINREFFGPLTSTLIEPSIPIVINIVQAVIAAFYGVRSISVGYAEQGNRWQDIAAINIMEELVNFYLKKYGYLNCQVTTVYHQYMAAFPRCEIKSEELIFQSSITAAIAKATKVMSKTPVEAIKIPSVEDNIRGVQLTKKGFLKSYDTIIDRQSIENEKELIRKEVVSIMNVIELLGNNNLAIGIIQAFEMGVLDIPFSPNKFNKGKVITFRGIDGAIRFADCGNMPFDESLKGFHQGELAKRFVVERESKVSKLIERDLVRVSKGDFKAWPLSSSYLD